MIILPVVGHGSVGFTAPGGGVRGRVCEGCKSQYSVIVGTGHGVVYIHLTTHSHRPSYSILNTQGRDE